MSDLPVAILVAAAVVVVVVLAIALRDLSRREVRHLPKWAWALVIVLVSFPLGLIVYLAVGRVPPGQTVEAGDGGDDQGGAPRRDGTALFDEVAVLDDASAAGRVPAGVRGRERPGGVPIVRTHDLGKVFGDTVALAGVDLAVPRGGVYGLIGPNGAGKTTLLSILAGLRRPSSGRVHLEVERRRIAVLADTPQFEPWLTAHEVVDLARHLTAPEAPAARVGEALATVGLAGAAQRRCGGFSRGMLQRLGIAGCLVGEPDLLLLDEPSSALDPAGRREVLDLVGRLGSTATVVLSTHILADVQLVCDTVGVIDHGRLRFQGPLHELLGRTSAAYVVHVRGDAGTLATELGASGWAEEVDALGPGRLRLVTADAERAERELPALVARLGLALVSFGPATDLETAFLELTR